MKGDTGLLGEITHIGKWWSPDNPSENIYGILKFKHDHIRLELSGVFTKKYISQRLRLETMHGLTNEGQKITLYQVSELYFSARLPTESESKNNFGESVFSCKYIFVGRHFNHAEDIIFNHLGMNFTYLDKWIDNKLEYKWDGDVHNIKTKSIDYELNLESICSTLQILSRPMNLGDYRTDIRILYRSGMLIKPCEAKNWKWFHEIINNLKNLLTLLIGYPVYPTHLSAEPIDGSNFDIIEIYYCQPNPLIIEDFQPWHIGIAFPDMLKYANRNVQKIAEVINNWFDKIEIIGPVFDLFFLTFYDLSMSDRTCFLTLMQAIETFHRRVHLDEKYLDDDEYEHVRKTLLNAIPEELEPDFKKSLKGGLKYGNELSLQSRLEKLQKVGPDKLKWFDMIMRDEKGIIYKLVATRNYYTHFSETSPKNTISEADLPAINYKLRLFLRILLLEQINSKGILSNFNVISPFLEKLKYDKEESQFLQQKENDPTRIDLP